MADHAAIFDSELFTFVCGPDEKRVIVHSYAITKVSEVLKAMVTNGMKETSDMTAKLPEVSGRVFLLFSAWCYSGAYRVVIDDKLKERPKSDNPNDSGENTPHIKPLPPTNRVLYGYYCHVCRTHADSIRLGRFPFCWRCDKNPFRGGDYCSRCGSDGVGESVFCDSCILLCSWKDGMNDANPTDEAAKPGVGFNNRLYPTEGMSHRETQDYLARSQPREHPTKIVSAHAELYVFANKYMVESLKLLCLHKLHRDLVQLKLNEETVVDVVKMLEFTYTNTSEDEGGGPGVGKDLRELVVAYTSWRAGELIKLGAFRAMMSKGGEYVGELIAPALINGRQ